MTFLGLFSAPSVLEAAWIFFIVCGCVASGCALGFGMGYRRGVNDDITHNGIDADRRRVETGTGLSSQHDAPRETETAIANLQRSRSPGREPSMTVR
jgi:hypothetical protein